jgi:hypothetical protein
VRKGVSVKVLDFPLWLRAAHFFNLVLLSSHPQWTQYFSQEAEI